jgi:hypothetical protein
MRQRVPCCQSKSQMKKYICALCLLPALLVSLPSTTAKADDVIVEDSENPDATVTYINLGWDENSEPDIAGYTVYYGRVSGDYTHLVTVTNPTTRIGVRGSRTVYFAVTAFDADGLESAFSAEVRWP